MIKRWMVLLWLVPLCLFGGTIKGQLVNRATMQPVKDGTVILRVFNQTPVLGYSDEKGKFVFEDVPEGRVVLETKVVGFYTEKREVRVQGETRVVFYLSALPTADMGEIEITAQRERAVNKTTVTRTEIQKASASLTSDPLDTLKKMPGVEPISSGDLATGSKLSVRGGQGFETMARLDGMLLQSFFHRGVIPDSFFIDDLVEEMVLYKGVAPVEYGQILSGFLQVKQIDPPTGFHGKFNFGLLYTYLALYGKTSDEKWQWAAGIRRTHYDLVLPLFFQPNNDTRTIQIPYYVDSHGKLVYKEGGDQWTLSYLFSLEPGYVTNMRPGQEVNGDFSYRYGGGAIQWRHLFASNVVLDQEINLMYTKNTMGMEQSSNITSRLQDDSLMVRYKVSPQVLLSENVSFQFGGEMSWYPLLAYSNLVKGKYFNIVTLQEEYTNFADIHIQTNTLIASAFVQGEFLFFDKKFAVVPGLRGSYFTVVDGWTLDPRINLEWRFDDRNKVYIGTGYLSQWTTDPFIFSFYTTNVEKRAVPGVWHGVLGTTRTIQDVWEMNLDTYVKHYVNPVTRSSNQQMEFQSGGMKHEIAGVEFLLKKMKGSIPLYGWISASYLQHWYFVEEGVDPNGFSGVQFNPDENGNLNGQVIAAWQFAQAPLWEWFSLPQYKGNITVVWDFARNWSLTAEFVYTSGWFDTPVTNVEVVVVGDQTNYIPQYGKFVSEKTPDSHSLNLKLEWTPTWFGLPWGIYLQVMNVYNYRPVYYRYNEKYEREEVRSPLGIYGYGGIWVKW